MCCLHLWRIFWYVSARPRKNHPVWAIPHANPRDQTCDTAMKSQCSSRWANQEAIGWPYADRRDRQIVGQQYYLLTPANTSDVLVSMWNVGPFQMPFTTCKFCSYLSPAATGTTNRDCGGPFLTLDSTPGHIMTDRLSDKQRHGLRSDRQVQPWPVVWNVNFFNINISTGASTTTVSLNS